MTKITFYETAWCKSCHKLKPIIQEIAYTNNWAFEAIDVEQDDSETSINISIVPTIFIDNHPLPDTLLSIVLRTHVFENMMNFASNHNLLLDPKPLITILDNIGRCPNGNTLFNCPCEDAKTHITQTGECQSKVYTTKYTEKNDACYLSKRYPEAEKYYTKENPSGPWSRALREMRTREKQRE